MSTTLHKNENAGLIMDPDFFGGVDKPQQVAGKEKNSINFLLGPKTSQIPARIKIKGDDGHLAEELKWARLVADEAVLKYDNRKKLTEKFREKLKKHLESLLTGLRLRYIEGNQQSFPTNFELAKLTKVIFALAKIEGVKKSDFGDLRGAINRIENRFSKVSLLGFATELTDECTSKTSWREQQEIKSFTGDHESFTRIAHVEDVFTVFQPTLIPQFFHE
jgi:hypothetical protein